MKFAVGALSVALLSSANSFSLGPAAITHYAGLTSRSTTLGRTTSHGAGCACPSCQKHGAGCACPGCRPHGAGCACAACSISSSHGASCACASCARTSRMILCSEVSSTAAESVTETTDNEAEGADSPTPIEAEVVDSPTPIEAEIPPIPSDDEVVDVPVQVEAMDGVQDEVEAHNVDRPARKSLSKKSKGKPLSEFKKGESVKGLVKTLTSYGAFIDFGAETDGLLHISQLSVDFVADVSEIIKEGQEVDVRIMKIDEGKKQVALSLLSESEEEQAKEQASAAASTKRGPAAGNSNRRDDSAVTSALQEKGWDPAQFVQGTVVSTVDFGAFVRIDASQLNADVSGEMDGLVHISALTAGRANAVTDYVQVDDVVQVRVNSIDGTKLSLSMVTVEEAGAKQDARAANQLSTNQRGAKDWKEQLEKLQAAMPEFSNRPQVVDLRK